MCIYDSISSCESLFATLLVESNREEETERTEIDAYLKKAPLDYRIKVMAAIVFEQRMT